MIFRKARHGPVRRLMKVFGALPHDRSRENRAIYRYPVKGLSPEQLARTELQPGRTVPFDRMYAIENGPSGFDPAKPGYLPKIAS